MKRSITYKKLLCLMGVPVFALSIAVMIGCGDDDDDPATTSPTKLYLFNEGTARNGNLVSRSNADALCSASANKPTGVTTARAFLSFSSSDEIADMPTTYSFPSDIPIYGPNGTSLVGNNWADLLDSLIPDTMANLGVIDSSSAYWTGSNADGTVHTSTCNGWTDGTGTYFGRQGAPTFTDGQYLNISQAPCDATRKIVCVGY